MKKSGHSIPANKPLWAYSLYLLREGDHRKWELSAPMTKRRAETEAAAWSARGFKAAVCEHPQAVADYLRAKADAEGK